MTKGSEAAGSGSAQNASLVSNEACRQTEMIIVRHEFQVVDTHVLVEEPLSIGRAPRCSIVLPCESVSRVHARIERHRDGWHIIDAGSVNGVRVNGQKLREATLISGDVIEIRPYALNYVQVDGKGGDYSLYFSRGSSPPTMTRDSKRASTGGREREGNLLGLCQMLLRRRGDGSLWQDVYHLLQRSLEADRCVILGIDTLVGVYRLAPSHRLYSSDCPLEISRTVLNEVVGSRKGILITSVPNEGQFAVAQSLTGNAITSVICAPIVCENVTKGVIYLDRAHSRPPFDAGDLEFVALAVDLAANAIVLDDLQARDRELSRVQGRIDAARDIQELLLPSPVPQPIWGHVAACNQPADVMSGDIYDVWCDSEGRFGVSVADVAGKGIPAAFLTSILQQTLRQSVSRLDNLDAIMQELNTALMRCNLPGLFATMVVCRWSASGNSAEIVNAGHHAPIWIGKHGEVNSFPERIGLPLGIEELWEGHTVVKDTCQDDLCLIFSDGLTESRDRQGDFYGLERLKQKASQLRSQLPEQMAEAITSDIRNFCTHSEPGDDLTLVIVQKQLIQLPGQGDRTV